MITLYLVCTRGERKWGMLEGLTGGACLSVLYMLEWIQREREIREGGGLGPARLWGGILLVYGTQ